MKILILCENIYYDKTSAGIVNTNIINALAKEYQIDCLYIERYNSKIPEFYASNKRIHLTKIDFESRKGFFYFLNKIKKVRALPSYISGLSSRDRNRIDNWRYFAEKKLQRGNYYLIIALGTGHEFLAHFAVAQLKSPVPKLLQIHDPFPLNIYPPPFAEDKKGIYKKLQKSFNSVLKNVDYVGFPSELLKNWMQQFYDFTNKQCILLPHPESFYNIDTIKKSSIIEDAENFNIGHIGALWDQRDPTALVGAFQRFSSANMEKKEHAHLYLLGGAASSHIEKLESKNSSNIHFINKRISYKESLEVQKTFIANIVIEVEAESSPIMPGKLADYINVDRPIIALTPQISETSRLLGANYRYKTNVDNEEEILRILNDLWYEWLNNKDLNLNRQDLADHISTERLLTSVKKII